MGKADIPIPPAIRALRAVLTALLAAVAVPWR